MQASLSHVPARLSSNLAAGFRRRAKFPHEFCPEIDPNTKPDTEPIN